MCFLNLLGLDGLKLNCQKLNGDFIDSCFLLEQGREEA
jgi:hypothetical protein